MNGDNESIVEQRIRVAAEQGAFDNLPGSGEPLRLEDSGLVPAELRAAYRILKNAGFAPPEVTTRKTVAELEAAVAYDSDAPSLDADARARVLRRLALLRAQAHGEGITAADTSYREKVMRRLAGQR